MIGFLLFTSTVFYAQSTASNAGFVPGTGELKELTDEDWSFFMDEENEVYYIDFETISVNLNDIAVRDKSGEVVFREDVWNLPVNTIYELDFSQYKPGEYVVELRSFTGVLKKNVTVK